MKKMFNEMHLSIPRCLLFSLGLHHDCFALTALLAYLFIFSHKILDLPEHLPEHFYPSLRRYISVESILAYSII